MFQILGGHFPRAYFDWLSDKEKKKFKEVIGHYDQSVFLDKVIHRLVTKNRLLKFDSLPDYVNPSLIKIIKKATHPNLRIRYSNTGEFMSDLFKVQKKLTNWIETENGLEAIKSNGDQFRIVSNKKGSCIEKLGKNGWRRNGEFVSTEKELFSRINRN